MTISAAISLGFLLSHPIGDFSFSAFDNSVDAHFRVHMASGHRGSLSETTFGFKENDLQDPFFQDKVVYSLATKTSRSTDIEESRKLHYKLTVQEPLTLWLRQGQVWIGASEGDQVPSFGPVKFTQRLEGLEPHVAEDVAVILRALETDPELKERVTAAVRVSKDRWNVKIEDRIEVRLPRDGLESAWKQLSRIERAHGLLSRDVAVIDLRLPDRMIVRTRSDPSS